MRIPDRDPAAISELFFLNNAFFCFFLFFETKTSGIVILYQYIDIINQIFDKKRNKCIKKLQKIQNVWFIFILQ